MDGIAAAQIIRERFSIPVVFLTALADDSIVNQAKVTEPLVRWRSGGRWQWE
jgi:two-component system, response regulator PdtaR